MAVGRVNVAPAVGIELSDYFLNHEEVDVAEMVDNNYMSLAQDIRAISIFSADTEYEGLIWDDEGKVDDITDDEIAMDKVTDSEIAMDKVTDSEMLMDKVTDKEMPMDKVTDKEMPMDKVMSKVMSRDKFYNALHWVDKGIYHRSDWAGEAILTENNWKDNKTFDQITDDETLMGEFTDSEQSMDDSTDSEVAMDKVTDKEMPMDKVTDSEIAMDKVMADVMPRTKMLLSPFVVDTMWSKVMASEKFWDNGTIEDESWKQNFGFSSATHLEFKHDSERDVKIWVAGELIYEDKSNGDWETTSLEINKNEGELRIGQQYTDDYDDVETIEKDDYSPSNGKSLKFVDQYGNKNYVADVRLEE